MKLALSIISVLAVIYLIALTLLYFFQRSLLFPAVGEATGIDRETIVIKHNEVELHGWVLNQGKSKAIIYFGGNAEQISNNIAMFEEVFEGHTVYLIDYRGYGRSNGEPTEQNLFADALHVYDQITPLYQSISAIGRSLGSGLGIYLAANRGLEKLVLLTPYDSIAEVAQSHYPMFPTRYLVRDKFESINRAADITVPVLIMAAEHDPVVPNIHTEKLLKRLTNSNVQFQMVKNVAHNNIEESTEYRTALFNFFKPH